LRIAIHQPNLFPRLRTLAKILRADRLVLLDNVQYCDREWQNRARLMNVRAQNRVPFWLTVPVIRPHGLNTRISDCRVFDPERSIPLARRTVQHTFGRSRWWPDLEPFVVPPLTDGLGDDFAALISTTMLASLGALGWRGDVYTASSFDSSSDRIGRLVDLCSNLGATEYLIGRGAKSYLDDRPFKDAGIDVTMVTVDDADVGASLPSNLSWICHAADLGLVGLSSRVRDVTHELPFTASSGEGGDSELAKPR
jgi:hypothetical protein